MDALCAAYVYESGDEEAVTEPPKRKKRKIGEEEKTTTNGNGNGNDNGREKEKKKKKKRLPGLAACLAPYTPRVDDPAQHQGRTRARAHVEGEFAAHVYVEVCVDKWDSGWEVVDSTRTKTKTRSGGGSAPGGGPGIVGEVWRRMCGAGEVEEEGEGVVVHPCVGSEVAARGRRKDGDGEEASCAGVILHISLSRPIYVRAHQRDSLRAAVRALARPRTPGILHTHRFTASFARFTTLLNDTRTRAFLALEVGAGHQHLLALAAGLAPFLESIHQAAFYPRPRFHASLVWTLMPRAAAQDNAGPDEDEDVDADEAEAEAEAEAAAPDLATPLDRHLPTLQTELTPQLLRTGTFLVDRVHVRIGNDVRSFMLKNVQ